MFPSGRKFVKFKFFIIILVLMSWIFSGWPQVYNFPPRVQQARADTITDSTPGTVASVADAGTGCTNVNTDDWATMTNTETSNNAYAIYGTGNFFDASEVSEEFQLSNFGILIPDGSTINGITVAIERKGTSADIQDRNINLTKTAGVQIGTNKAVAADWPTTDATATYGSGSDLWGTTWSEAEVEATGFGLVICVQTLAGDANAIASIDFINITVTYTAPPTTTIGDGTNPSNTTIGPSAAATSSDAFTFITNTGTDSITNVTTTLAANTTSSIAKVEITSDDGSTVYGSSTNPTASNFSISLSNLTANTTQTQYKIRITPKSHANMPAPPGSTYTVTSTITAWTGTNAQAGSDAASTVVTIDNESPANATLTSGSAGDTKVTLNWTTSASSDFSRSVVLRWAASTPGSEVPAEGTDYANGNTIGAATVACVRTADAASTAVSGTDGAGTGGCGSTALTNGQAYSYKIFQKDSNGNYDVGFTFSGSPFTPQASTISCSTNVGSTDFGSLTSGSVNTASPNSSTTMSCANTGTGCTLYVKDAGGGGNPGLWNSGLSYLIPSPNSGFSSTSTLVAGTEGYGIQAETTLNGSGGTLSIAPRYLQTGNVVGGLSASDLILASSTADVFSREVLVTHKVAISGSTPSGSYSDTITYSCLSN